MQMFNFLFFVIQGIQLLIKAFFLGFSFIYFFLQLTLTLIDLHFALLKFDFGYLNFGIALLNLLFMFRLKGNEAFFGFNHFVFLKHFCFGFHFTPCSLVEHSEQQVAAQSSQHKSSYGYKYIFHVY